MATSKLHSPTASRLFLLTLLMAGLVPHAGAQDCETALEEALEASEQKRHENVISLLTRCPPEQLLEKEQKMLAYDLVAQSYFAMGNVDSTKATVRKLCQLNRSYSPPPPKYSMEYIALVNTVMEEEKPRRSLLSNKWVWVGGIAAASVTTYLILNKSGAELLPKPPDPPPIP